MMYFFFSSRRRHTICALVTGVQTCALPILEVAHFPARRDESLEAQARRAVGHALATHEGDVLVFLPGRREIARLQAALPPPNLPLPSQGEAQGLAILPPHGDLTIEIGSTSRRETVGKCV